MVVSLNKYYGFVMGHSDDYAEVESHNCNIWAAARIVTPSITLDSLLRRIVQCSVVIAESGLLAPYALIADGETTGVHRILPDRHGVATTRERELDRFPIRCASAGR